MWFTKSFKNSLLRFKGWHFLVKMYRINTQTINDILFFFDYRNGEKLNFRLLHLLDVWRSKREYPGIRCISLHELSLSNPKCSKLWLKICSMVLWLYLWAVLSSDPLKIEAHFYTGIAEVMGSNPVQAWIFFRPYFLYCSQQLYKIIFNIMGDYYKIPCHIFLWVVKRNLA